MNRNSYQTYSGGHFGATQSYKPGSSGFGNTAGQRTPLYPIGPSIVHPQLKGGIQRGVSPYLSRQGLHPPSYEQKYHHQTVSGFQQMGSTSGGRRYDVSKTNYEERERELIGRNETEIEEEHKRREQIRMSYEREIGTKNASMSRNLERKQRLLAQIDGLESTREELHTKLMSIRPPTNSINTFEPIDRKQQEMIIMKNKLVNQMREKESDLLKDQEEQQKFWENQLAQKEKILMKLESQGNSRRIELNIQKNSLQKPDLVSLEDQIREERYQDFIFNAAQIESKINCLIEQREKLTAEVTEGLVLNKPQMHSLRQRREELGREREEILLRVSDLQRIGKEMEEANANLLNEYERKQEMIEKYENDIQQLKDKKKIQEEMMGGLFQRAREADEELIPGLTRQISRVAEELRVQQTKTTRLKTQYQRLYELLCSATIKNLHQTFGTIHSQDFRT